MMIYYEYWAQSDFKIIQYIESMIKTTIRERDNLIKGMDNIQQQYKLIDYLVDLEYLDLNFKKPDTQKQLKCYKFIQRCLILDNKQKINLFLINDDIRKQVNQMVICTKMGIVFNYINLLCTNPILIFSKSNTTFSSPVSILDTRMLTFKERFYSEKILYPYFIYVLSLDKDGVGLIFFYMLKFGGMQIKNYFFFLDTIIGDDAFDFNKKINMLRENNIEMQKINDKLYIEFIKEYNEIMNDEGQKIDNQPIINFFAKVINDKPIDVSILKSLNDTSFPHEILEGNNKLNFLIISNYSSISLIFSFVYGMCITIQEYDQQIKKEFLEKIPNITLGIQNLLLSQYNCNIIIDDFLDYITIPTNWTGATSQIKKKSLIDDKTLYTTSFQITSETQIMHTMTNYFKCVLILFDGDKIYGLYPYCDYQEFSIEDIEKLVVDKQIKVSFIIKKDKYYNTIVPKPLDQYGNYDENSYKELDDIYIDFFRRISSKIIWNEL